MAVESKLILDEYEQRLLRPERLKSQDLQEHGRLKHVILANQFSRELLEDLGETADMIRELQKVPEGTRFLRDLLPEIRAMLYFTQASTRTFLSFTAACQLLGITVNEIRDPALSSEYKGESPFDSVRMFSSYFDLVIMRSRIPNLAESCAYLMNDLQSTSQRNVPIINGGAGADEHPTQALLDIYTIQRSFAFQSKTDTASSTYFDRLRQKDHSLTKGVDNKLYCFCGDIGRSRTVRSLVNLLVKYDNVRFCFVAPGHGALRLTDDLKVMLRREDVEFWEEDNLDNVIGDVDILYMTRVQHEHDKDVEREFFESTDMSRFKLTPSRVAKMKEHARIMHPFPRLDEIPTSIDRDHRALYFRQARNGMWARAALIAHLFDVERKIATMHRKTFESRHNYNTDAL